MSKPSKSEEHVAPAPTWNLLEPDKGSKLQHFQHHSVITTYHLVEHVRLAYDLYVPTERSGSLPGVVMFHGFGCDRRSLSGHAERLASRGRAIVLLPDGSTLLRPGAQQRNVDQAFAACKWLAKLLGNPVAVVGHSVGGAIALEVAGMLTRIGEAPRGLLLLDPVPWPRTHEVATCFPAEEVRTLALLTPESSWNRNGEMWQVLSKIPSPGTLAVSLPFARHGDPVTPLPHPRGWRMLGLMGEAGSLELIARLMDEFLDSTFSCRSAHDFAFQDGLALETIVQESCGKVVVKRRRGPVEQPRQKTAETSSVQAAAGPNEDKEEEVRTPVAGAGVGPFGSECDVNSIMHSGRSAMAADDASYNPDQSSSNFVTV